MQSDFLYLVEEELAAAREKHQGPIHSAHEAYGVIAEEVAEFFDQVRMRKTAKAAMLSELVQIAAMCYRAAEDLQLLEVEMTQEFVNAAIAKHIPADLIPICNSAQEEDYYRELRLKSAYKEGEL